MIILNQKGQAVTLGKVFNTFYALIVGKEGNDTKLGYISLASAYQDLCNKAEKEGTSFTLDEEVALIKTKKGHWLIVPERPDKHQDGLLLVLRLKNTKYINLRDLEKDGKIEILARGNCTGRREDTEYILKIKEDCEIIQKFEKGSRVYSVNAVERTIESQLM